MALRHFPFIRHFSALHGEAFILFSYIKVTPRRVTSINIWGIIRFTASLRYYIRLKEEITSRIWRRAICVPVADMRPTHMLESADTL